ncbi:hypothetical protein PV325_013117 [Microctonus aethiopoides]|nr:hypothetical protein PV325_013117 [Microctonus aethiopoides]
MYLTIPIAKLNISANGRKLFGGYQIVPKKCQPINPSKVNSNEPAICMFNYECSRRQGKVVGACMDGFLFGACCQLPSSSDFNYHSSEISPLIINEKLDHVPDIPILLKPDGTPVDDTIIDQRDTTSKPSSSSLHSTLPQISELEQNFPAFLGSQSIIDDLSMPVLLSHSESNNDIQEKKETISPSNPVITLLSPDQVLQIADPVDQLPGLFSQSFGPSNYSIAETVLINNNGSIVDDTNNPDDLFKPVNRSTTLSDYFINNEGNTATTKMLPVKYMNTEKFTESTTQPITTGELVRVPTINYEIQSGNKKHDDEYDREEIAINHIISILNGSTPNSSPKTPMRITTQYNSNNSPSINSWVTLDQTSMPSTNSETFPYAFYKPSTKPTNYYYYDSNFSSSTENGIQSVTTRPSYSNYYTTTNQKYVSPHDSSSSNYLYPNKPTTLQPAPTVIVLGPFDTNDDTTDFVTTPKSIVTNKLATSSVRPNSSNKKPNIGTTITHNISTIISTHDTATASATSNIISTSFVNFKLKDPSASNSISTQPDAITKKPTTIWTTLSTWSSKPSFQLKPGKPEVDWPQENLTPIHTLIFKTTQKPSTTSSGVDTDDGTPAPDDLSNFPPDRNPNLTNSTLTSQQEKPTIIETFNNTGYPVIELVSENEIPTPSFNEDDVLKNKVDDFVNKIVDSLQDNFQNLKDVVYTRKNTTSTPGYSTAATQKPPIKKPTAKPTGTRRPTVKRPNQSSKPSTIGSSSSAKPIKVTRLPKPTTPRPPGSVTTKKTTISTTTKRPKPTKKIATTVTQPSTTSTSSTTSEIILHDVASTESVEETPTRKPDFRSECGVRPMIKKGRVVGGKAANFGEWPWQVLVREATWLGLFTKNKCGGVLITENYVITAAHCQPGFLASLVAVFGEHDISGKLESRPSVTRNVKRVIVNRAYNPATFENDLALLELETPVNFDAHIVPICMPPDNADYTGRMATVTGWGRLKYNGGVPSILQEVQVPVMENSVCQEMFRTAGHSKRILDSFLCAGYANGQKDSCEGDSGGPLMIERPDGRYELAGTVSHGIKCAAPYLPGVYMRTTFFKPWLHSERTNDDNVKRMRGQFLSPTIYFPPIPLVAAQAAGIEKMQLRNSQIQYPSVSQPEQSCFVT